MKLTPIEGKKLIKILSFIGYFPVRQKGSHVILEHRESKKITIVPLRSKDVGVGLISTILKQVELSREDYFKFLQEI
ncbi:MAG: type II toxin-antitoxin system HicA family toxin [Candidatus Micrarchaeota archaeon]|nr:type II toxin-antitoxin system HicA family toxin [Candidatus Micrarchaeota archaeon]